MNIEKIVSLVLDDKFETNHLWYSIGTKINRDETKQLEDSRKELKSVMTDFIVYEFLNTTSQICKFISTVYNVFNGGIHLYNMRTNNSDNDIFFVYKGGNILRFVSNQVFYMLPGKVKEDLITYYRDSFKKSDADFSIYINPKLPNFDKIFNDMTNLSFLLQNHLRNIFIQERQDFFNFYNLNESKKAELFKNYLDMLNNTDIIKNQPLDDIYSSISLPSINYTDNTINFTHPEQNAVQQDNIAVNINNNQLTKLAYIPKFDSEMIFGKKSNMLTSLDLNDPDNMSTMIRYEIEPIHLKVSNNRNLKDLEKGQLQLYGNISQSEFVISVNRATTFLSGTTLRSFNLVRTKVSFNTMKITNIGPIMQKMDGELIDVSIINRDDSSIEHFFEKRSEYVVEYKLQEDECKIPFRSYSIEYLISDLENILFIYSSYPWEDNKYAKRLKRLIFLYYLSFFTKNNFKNNYDRMTYLAALQKNILLPSLKYPSISREQLLSQINSFVTKFNIPNHNFIFKNLIDKIKNMILDDNLDLDKFHEFIKSVIENIDVLYQSLVGLNQYVNTSGSIDENKIYQGQLGGDYHHKYLKYKNKYQQLKYLKN